ncbi:MAG: response regulator transcription factor [Flavobacteriaceae bacterium]|nr:response regulator transcription factor [Flavobacteriaceae bacterium]
MKYWLTILTVLLFCNTNAQYSFSGNVDNQRWQNTVYLSLVEDYRKLSGLYSEQVIAKTTADSLGFFEFTGNQLENAHRMYRIHVDNCNGSEPESNHFGGHCPDSKEIVFIAKNTDTINFPFSFDAQMFCDIVANNQQSLAIMKIDSLKEDMRFAYTEIRSEASRKLNNKKWFKILQDQGKNLNEPLAELYVYSFLSDRSSEFHDYYLEDLKTNPYYDDLEERLVAAYPSIPYSKQFVSDIEADRYAISRSSSSFPWIKILAALLIISMLANALFYNKARSKRTLKSTDLKSALTKQEQTILDHILDDKSNKDIAESLFVSVSTVKTHINSIYKKLNVSTREDAKSLFSKN